MKIKDKLEFILARTNREGIPPPPPPKKHHSNLDLRIEDKLELIHARANREGIPPPPPPKKHPNHLNIRPSHLNIRMKLEPTHVRIKQKVTGPSPTSKMRHINANIRMKLEPTHVRTKQKVTGPSPTSKMRHINTNMSPLSRLYDSNIHPPKKTSVVRGNPVAMSIEQNEADSTLSYETKTTWLVSSLRIIPNIIISFLLISLFTYLLIIGIAYCIDKFEMPNKNRVEMSNKTRGSVMNINERKHSFLKKNSYECICRNGTPASDCASSSTEKCLTCRPKYGMTVSLTCEECSHEHQMYSMLNDNSPCKAHLQCPAGQGSTYSMLLAQNKHLTTQSSCKPCDVRHYSSTNDYGSCLERIVSCPPGKKFSPGSSFTNAVCTACEVGKYKIGYNNNTSCNPYTVTKCGSGKYFTAGTMTSDGTCTQCSSNEFKHGENTETKCTVRKTSCGPGSFFTSGSLVADATCTPCSPNHFKMGNNDETACRLKTMQCEPGKYYTKSELRTQDSTCTPCPDGKVKVGTNELTSCQSRQCSCSNGTPATGLDCPQHQVEKCTKCIKAFGMNDNGACVACTDDEYNVGNNSSSCAVHRECPPGMGSNYMLLKAMEEHLYTESICYDCDSATFSSTLSVQPCEGRYSNLNIDLLYFSLSTPLTLQLHLERKSSCPPGTFFTAGSVSQDATCTKCQLGKYKTGTNNQTTCQSWSSTPCNEVYNHLVGSATEDVKCIPLTCDIDNRIFNNDYENVNPIALSQLKTKLCNDDEEGSFCTSSEFDCLNKMKYQDFKPWYDKNFSPESPLSKEDQFCGWYIGRFVACKCIQKNLTCMKLFET
eukprot:g2976.t1